MIQVQRSNRPKLADFALFHGVLPKFAQKMLARRPKDREQFSGARLITCRRIVLLAALLAVGPLPVRAAAPSQLPPASAVKVDFVKDIQPILSKHCYECHGPQKQKGELRWDVKQTALKGGASGPALIPGKSAESLVVQLVSGIKADVVMPQKGDRLTREQIGMLRAWIDQGANWPEGVDPKYADKRDHWAFKAPVRPAEPKVKNKKWGRNPIDSFVLARLEKQKLSPSPEADRVTLIRRLSLDLIGLPPTIEEVDRFVADKSPDAYERVVERLLASPHYGERWGRYWLDAARYADSNGYEKDATRSIWPYRDYVISAFNRDLPFDQFTLEQLAGDLLPNPTLDQRVATGFLRNSMLNQEGGIEPEQFRFEAMVDRMDAIGKAWLGLSINCCQCHNHKFDPFLQKDYYSIFAFFNNDDEPFLEVPTPEQQKQRDEIASKARSLENKAMHNLTNLSERLAAWEQEIGNAQGEWVVLDPREWLNFATKYEKQTDGSLLGGGDVKPGAVTHVWVDTKLTNITGFRLEVMTDPNLPYGGPGLVAKGGFLLREFTCEAYATHDPTVTNKVKFQRALASLEAPGFSITNTIDGITDKGGWTASLVPVLKNREQRAVFECAEPLDGFEGGTTLKFTVYQKHSSGDGHTGELDKDTKLDCHSFGRFRLSATTQTTPLTVDPLTAAQRKLLAIPATQRTATQTAELFDVFRFSDAALAKSNSEIDSVWTNWPYAARTLALSQRPEPRVTHILKRGDRLRPLDEVQPDVPGFLHSFPKDAPRNRLGFAKWVIDPRSPTTARVLVNRIWQAYFGAGLVTTPEDFGTRVEPPSHPELLDWLACELMSPKSGGSPKSGESPKSKVQRPKSNGQSPMSSDQNPPATVQGLETLDIGLWTLDSPDSPRPWSFKHMHRLIVNSATYKQSSKVTPQLYAADQYNRLLARGPRFRVEGEIIQDIALSVSGLLNPRIGGPSVFPPIPGSVADTVYGGFTWPESKGDDRYRRGMYTFWKRALPFPTLLAFDAPPAENSCTRRGRSNTPLQALATLNERTFVEAAQAMGLRVIKEGGNENRTRAAYAFRLAVGRAPTAAELKSLLSFWDDQFKYFENNSAAALRVALADPKAVPADVNIHKVAAWAMTSRAILNLDETMTKE